MHLKLTLNVTQETLLLPTTIMRNGPIINENPAAVGIPIWGPEDPAANNNGGIAVGAPENPAAPELPALIRRSA